MKKLTKDKILTILGIITVIFKAGAEIIDVVNKKNSNSKKK